MAEPDVQRNNPRQVGVAPVMDPIGLGVVVAIANVIVIAACMNVMERASGFTVAGSVFVFSFMPALFTGALLGRLAHKTRTWPVWIRWILLASPALLLVVGLGRFFQFPEYVLPSFVPTLAAAWCLEQRTRDRVPALARAVARQRSSCV
jgi:hypothetical protein